MSVRTDGLEDYTLGKDYGENKAGDVIPVDGERKEWLDKNGYRQALLEEAPPETPVIRRRKPLIELETPPTTPDLTLREV